MQDILRHHFKKEFAKNGKTQTGCAEFTQISKSKLSLSLNGKREFQLNEIGPIARYLECGLPKELLVELNAAASLKVPVIGTVEPGVVRPFLGKGTFEDVYVPYVPMQDIANLEQYAQLLKLNTGDAQNFFNGHYYLSCVDYNQARHGFFDDRDVVVGLRKKPEGYEKTLWKISVVSQKAYASQLLVEGNEMVKISPYGNADRGELEILDLVLAIFIGMENRKVL